MKMIIVVIVAYMYSVAWVTASLDDRQKCYDHGVEYVGTSLSLEGYCSVRGIEVPVEGVWRDD